MEPPLDPIRTIRREKQSVRVNVAEIGREQQIQFAEFCKMILHWAGYVFIIIPFEMFQEWHKTMNASAFGVTEYPYVLNKSSSSIARIPCKSYPQNNALSAVLHLYFLFGRWTHLERFCWNGYSRYSSFTDWSIKGFSATRSHVL